MILISVLLALSVALNVAWTIAFMKLNNRYETDYKTWQKSYSQWAADKEIAIQNVHAQWKQYVDKIHPPGQA